MPRVRTGGRGGKKDIHTHSAPQSAETAGGRGGPYAIEEVSQTKSKVRKERVRGGWRCYERPEYGADGEPRYAHASAFQGNVVVDWQSVDIPHNIRRPWHVFEDDLQDTLHSNATPALRRLSDLATEIGAWAVFPGRAVQEQRLYADVALSELSAYVHWRCHKAMKLGNVTAGTAERTSLEANWDMEWDLLQEKDKVEWVPKHPRRFLEGHDRWAPLLADGSPPCGSAGDRALADSSVTLPASDSAPAVTQPMSASEEAEAEAGEVEKEEEEEADLEGFGDAAAVYTAVVAVGERVARAPARTPKRGARSPGGGRRGNAGRGSRDTHDLPMLPLARVVRQIACHHAARSGGAQVRISQQALRCLQGVSEAYLVAFFERGNVARRHAGRDTLRSEDLRLAERMHHANSSWVLEHYVAQERMQPVQKCEADWACA